MEERDLAAALRLSLNDDWDSDEEKSGANDDADMVSADSDDEEEPVPPAPAEVEAEWSDNLRAIEVPLSRLRHGRQQPPLEQTPFQLLQLFLPQHLMEEFAGHTNAGAPDGWPPTTADELYAFIGAHLFMGINRLPRTEMYWSASYSNPLLTSVFSRGRFKDLLRYFRVVAPDPAAAPRDPVPHIQSLAAKLNASFEANYIASHNIAIDEAMVAYKGRSPIKQYIPSKPHKWGYKIYCLSSDGYLLRFEVYAGKEEKSVDGATYDTVMRLIKGYENKQHVLYTDNWFTSPTLLHDLQSKGIRLCGSVRSNRKGMPPIPKEELSALEQGKWIQRQKGDTSLAVWKDQKIVWVLYNHCSPLEVASLDRWNDFGARVAIDCPRALRDYFYHARSVDILSQLHYSYFPGRKARRCWPRLAWWLLDMCIINAFKLWSSAAVHPGQLRFREELMHDLLQRLPPAQAPRKRGASLRPAHALASEHFPEHVGEKRDCVVCSHRPENRVQSRIVCHACQVHLCTGSCFSTYHA